MVGAKLLTDGAAQRTAAAGLRPPPLAPLIEGTSRSVNAFRRPQEPGSPLENADKLLMRLNFTCCPGIG